MTTQYVTSLLEDDTTYNFGEILANSNSLDPQLVNTVELFAYGNYGLYEKYRSQYHQLTKKQLLKLIKLSIISLANDFEGYSVNIDQVLHDQKLESGILQYLSMTSGAFDDEILQVNETSVDGLERIIIDMKYHGLVDVKIDQLGQKLNIVKAIVLRDSYDDESKLRVLTGEDVANRLTGRAIASLQEWLEGTIVPLKEEILQPPE